MSFKANKNVHVVLVWFNLSKFAIPDKIYVIGLEPFGHFIAHMY